MKHRASRNNERGSQIVEFAVGLPLIILLALLVAEGANMFRVFQLVTNAAREGARLSTLPQDRYIAINNTTNYNLTNPQTCTFEQPSGLPSGSKLHSIQQCSGQQLCSVPQFGGDRKPRVFADE